MLWLKTNISIVPLNSGCRCDLLQKQCGLDNNERLIRRVMKTYRSTVETTKRLEPRAVHPTPAPPYTPRLMRKEADLSRRPPPPNPHPFHSN